MAWLLSIWCFCLALGISGAFGGAFGLELQNPESYEPSPSDPVTRYGHDAAGRIVLTVLPNDCVTRQVRDARGWLMSTTTVFQTAGAPNALRSMADYTQPHKPGAINGYDAVGNVCKVREGYHALPARDVVNVYDHTYRLAAERRITYQAPLAWNAVASDELDRYQYDAANNRTRHQKFNISGGVDYLVETKTYLSGSPQIGYNTNQLVGVSPELDPSAANPLDFTLRFTYDANGNRRTKTSHPGTDHAQEDVLSYDQRNRLISVDLHTVADSSAVGLHSYRYDYRGRRTSTMTPETGPEGSGFSFAGGNYVQEFDLSDASGASAVEIVRGSDLGGGIGGILYSERQGAAVFNHYNSRGDVVGQTNGGGAVTWEAAYEGFGQRTAEDGTATGRQRANTKDEDLTGLLNEGHRYRCLETGTFITRDPAGFIDGPNVYTYVRQNPWTAFDPMGLFEIYVHTQGRIAARLGGGYPIGHVGITTKSKEGFTHFDTGRYKGTYKGEKTLGPNVHVKTSGGVSPSSDKEGFKTYNFVVDPKIDQAIHDSFQAKFDAGKAQFPEDVKSRLSMESPEAAVLG